MRPSTFSLAVAVLGFWDISVQAQDVSSTLNAFVQNGRIEPYSYVNLAWNDSSGSAFSSLDLLYYNQSAAPVLDRHLFVISPDIDDGNGGFVPVCTNAASAYISTTYSAPPLTTTPNTVSNPSASNGAAPSSNSDGHKFIRRGDNHCSYNSTGGNALFQLTLNDTKIGIDRYVLCVTHIHNSSEALGTTFNISYNDENGVHTSPFQTQTIASRPTEMPSSSYPWSTTNTTGVTISPVMTTTSLAPSAGAFNSGLGVGAKAGVAIGVTAFAFVAMIAGLLLWRRNRKQSHGVPSGRPYDRTLGGTHRDVQAEKEMNVINIQPAAYEPLDGHAEFANAPSVTHSPIVDEHEQHEVDGPQEWSGHDIGAQGLQYNNSIDHGTSSLPMPYITTGHNATSVSHLREPGMSAEELERLDEEERRLDEAIAEAERRGSGH